MKRVFIIVFLLFFSDTVLFAQKYGHEYIDSLQTELQKAKEDTNKVILLDRLSDCYYYNFDSGLYYAQNAVSLSAKQSIS
jgi:hypothetical protein